MSPQPASTFNRTKQKTVDLWLRLFLVANRALVLFVMIGIHKGLDIAAEWVVPKGWTQALAFLLATFYCSFMLVYLHFCLDMVATFIPVLQSKLLGSDEP